MTPQYPEYSLPWMPTNVSNYLLHTARGIPIRELARQQGCHASTILRQVRRVEARRDDPLVDAGLTRLADEAPGPGTGAEAETGPLAEDGARFLRRLCETGAILAVAEGMENAVVMRAEGGSDGTRTAVMPVATAQAMALCDWISCHAPGRVSRYRVTAAGRAALGRMLARTESRASADGGFAETQAVFSGAPAPRGGATQRYRVTESPLIALARRRDRDGNRFLDRAQVHAGERLREDFELAQLAGPVSEDWRGVMSETGGRAPAAAFSPASARDRLAAALQELGPGLGDVALRCCCHLEGLEETEKRMGWSARSGKIVLRIALQRLTRHYEQMRNLGADLIG